jgi:hypothetical protein
MATADITLDSLKAFFDKMDPSAAVAFFQKLSGSSDKLREAFTSLNKMAENTSKGMSALGHEMKDNLVVDVEAAEGAMKSFTESIGVTGDKLVTIGLQAAVVGVVLKSGLRPDAFEKISSATNMASANFDHMKTTLTGVGKLLSTLPGSEWVAKKLANLGPAMELANDAKKLESGMLAIASASGDLGNVFNQIGSDMSGLDAKMQDFTIITSAAANATGMTTKETGQYASELMHIPGALDMMVKSTSAGGQEMRLLEASMKVATGTGQDFHAVFNEINTVYERFGTTGQKALEYVSRLSSASRAMQMPLQIVKEYTESAADSFKFLGDNSQGAISILGNFNEALKGSGIGPKTIAELAQVATKSIANMGTAQQAFLSSTAGGAGGLQGSAQIDLLKKQGKTEDIQKMVEESLRKQMGGRLVSTEEAAKDTSGAAAAQREKQLLLLQSGPTKMADTRDQAIAISDAMAKGKIASSKIASPEAALKESVDKGTALQKRQTDGTVLLTNLAEKQVMYAAITAYAAQRNLTGSKGPASDFIDKTMRQATSTGAAQQMFATDKRKMQHTEGTPEQEIETLKDSVADVLSNIFGSNAKKAGEQKSALHKGATPAGTSHMTPHTADDGVPSHFGAAVTPRSRVAGDMRADTAGDASRTPRGGAGGIPGGRGESSTIQVQAVCAECNKKIAKAVAIDIVNGKISRMQRDQINGAHGVHTDAVNDDSY